MVVVNCRGCGRLFNQISRERLCPLCKEKLEDKFQQVKKYLTENPNATIEEISRDNDVTSKQIKQWVREERLVFSKDSPVGIECESCGKMIRCGKYCDTCKGNLTHTLQSALDKKTVPLSPTRDRSGDRMRFLQ